MILGLGPLVSIAATPGPLAWNLVNLTLLSYFRHLLKCCYFFTFRGQTRVVKGPYGTPRFFQNILNFNIFDTYGGRGGVIRSLCRNKRRLAHGFYVSHLFVFSLNWSLAWGPCSWPLELGKTCCSPIQSRLFVLLRFSQTYLLKILQVQESHWNILLWIHKKIPHCRYVRSCLLVTISLRYHKMVPGSCRLLMLPIF